MPRRPSHSRVLATAAVWPVGILLTSWHYMWRTTVLHRRDLPGSPETDAAPPVPAGASLEEAQLDDVGVGRLFRRRYRTRIKDGALGACDLMAKVMADPNALAPTEFARFTKVRGDRGAMAVGDEFVVRMPGPWDGPVRVVEATPRSFRLITLEGHLEAGQIQFRADDEGGCLVFTIESWARSGDWLSLLLYQHLRMAKEVQFHMWTSFLERAAKVAGGRLDGGIDVETRCVADDVPGPPRPFGTPEARRTLDALHAKTLNFEPADRPKGDGDGGWVVDEYCQPLPPEPPGPPVAGGSWEVARRLMDDYEFADPSIVRAVYHPDRPLAERDMLLEARFYGLRFRFGVRVGGVVDEIREVDGRPVKVWGWNYRTLQGHLERGQMDYEVWKWLDTGQVEFHTRRFSRRAAVANPIVRLGLWLFGRHQQVKFARRACDRMARLTAAALEEAAAGGGSGEAPE